jgi:transposase
VPGDIVGEVAAQLGVSENTVRRMEAEGVIPKARRVKLARGKSVRAYSAKDIERISRSRPRERCRTKHPGRWTTKTRAVCCGRLRDALASHSGGY